MCEVLKWKIRRLERMQKECKFDILKTPSSPKREKLTDANIHILAAIEALKETEHAAQQY